MCIRRMIRLMFLYIWDIEVCNIKYISVAIVNKVLLTLASLDSDLVKCSSRLVASLI